MNSGNFGWTMFWRGTKRLGGKMTKYDLLVCLISLFLISQYGQCMPSDVKAIRKDNSLADLKKMDKSTSQASHRLYRRISTALVPIRDREKTAVCTYEVVTDVNIHRIPNKIDRILCRKDECRCTSHGDYSCTQLYTQLNVTYLTPDLKSATLEFDLINVEYACVCSRPPGAKTIIPFEPPVV